MHSTLIKWLKELEDETEIAISAEINEEAQSNMVSFGFNEGLLEEWSKESVHNFITSCADIYKLKSLDSNMVFYLWFDEQASQIRISSVSQVHNKLPFDCKLKSVGLSQMVNGIYSKNSGLYTNGALDIWCQNI